MNIAETITHLRAAKKALKEATERVNMCHRTVNGLLDKMPHCIDHIHDDFYKFCDNSHSFSLFTISLISEDFEDIRDPDEVMEDIEEAVNLAGNEKRLDFDSQDEFNQESLARCNAYLAVRDRWMIEVCNAIENQ